jgi:hypothetical protein
MIESMTPQPGADSPSVYETRRARVTKKAPRRRPLHMQMDSLPQASSLRKKLDGDGSTRMDRYAETTTLRWEGGDDHDTT